MNDKQKKDFLFVQSRREKRNFTVSSMGVGKDLNIEIKGSIFVSKIDKRDVSADFEIGKVLGQGAYGKVFLVKNKKTRLLRAMKTLRKKMVKDGEKDNFLDEVKLLMSMDHPGIVKVFNFYEDKKYFRIITEYFLA